MTSVTGFEPAPDEQGGGYFCYWEESKSVLLLDLGKYAAEGQTDPSRAALPVRRAGAGPVRRRAGRRAVRAAAVGGSLALVAGVTGLLPAEGAAPTARVLQSAVISLSPDGSMTEVQTTDIRQDTDGRFSTAKKTIDPRVAAADIPVVVSMAYLHDGKTGTDLADLKGVKGLVEIDVTLTNTTAHSEAFTVSGPGATDTTFAPVSIPLTVVGTATLAKSDYSEIVLPPAGSPAPHTTNGVVRPRDGDTTEVQWASVLAPPRLPASATFRIVQRTDGFTLPEITLSVQPGLTADPSLPQLLARAFGNDSPILHLQNVTARLIGTVNSALVKVDDILTGVHAELIAGAENTGVAATQDLRDTSATARQNLEFLVAALGDLGESVTTTLEKTNALADSRMRLALEGLKTYIGVPATLPAVRSASSSATGSPTTGACTATGRQSDPATSLYQQLQHVTDVLRQAATATTECVGAMRGSLLDTIGEKSSCAAPTAGPAPLVCRILATRDRLAVVRAEIVSSAEEIAADLQQSGLGDVTKAVDKVVGAVKDLQNRIHALGTRADLDSVLVQGLKSVKSQLDDLLPDLDPAFADGLGHELALVHKSSLRARDAVGTTGDDEADDTTHGRLNALADRVCDVPTGDDSVAAYAAELRARIDGGVCPSASPVPVPGVDGNLAERAIADRVAWQEIADLTDPAGVDGVGAELMAVRDQVFDLGVLVTAALNELIDSEGPALPGSFKERLAAVKAGSSALYDEATTTARCTDPGSAIPPLNALDAKLGRTKCDQDSLAAKLQALVATAPSKLDQLTGEMDSASDFADQAGVTADGRIADLGETLTGRFTGSADDEMARGLAALQIQVAALTRTVRESTELLDDATQQAVAEIATAIEAAKASDAQANDALQRSLTDVLLSLGGPTTGGLLGLIYDNGGKVHADGQQPIRQTAATARGFGSVRRLSAQDIALENQRHEKGLGKVDELPYLGGTLPDGATHSSVYILHVAGH